MTRVEHMSDNGPQPDQQIVVVGPDGRMLTAAEAKAAMARQQ